MSYSLLQIVSFGASKAGLATVGYRVMSLAAPGPRITDGISDLLDGHYAALITFDDDFQGWVRWDTGEVPNVYVNSSINPPVPTNINAEALAQILASGDIDGYSLEQTLKLCLAALSGKVSGGGTTEIIIRAADDSKARITATVDSNGNRSAVTLDAAG